MLFVTPERSFSGNGGRAQLSRLHWRCIQSLFDGKAQLYGLAPSRVGFVATLTGRIDGADRAAEHRLIQTVEQSGVGQVYLDGSNLGRLARALKLACPGVRVLTFCHNVEARFFLGAFRHKPSLRTGAILLANSLSERMAACFSDRLIALNARDSALLKKLYGRAATDILPMGLDEPAPLGADLGAVARDGEYLLFVGGAFYANLSAIRWYARHVAPRADMETCVVGRDLDTLAHELQASPNIRLIGEVDDLAPWYRGARAVVAPIFEGSGMKTKVAEAVMHGKHVIGTTEAFTGYEEWIEQIGWRCDDAGSFLAAVRALRNKNMPEVDPALRLLFEQQFSYQAARNRLSSILCAGARDHEC